MFSTKPKSSDLVILCFASQAFRLYKSSEYITVLQSFQLASSTLAEDYKAYFSCCLEMLSADQKKASFK